MHTESIGWIMLWPLKLLFAVWLSTLAMLSAVACGGLAGGDSGEAAPDVRDSSRVESADARAHDARFDRGADVVDGYALHEPRSRRSPRHDAS